MKKIIFSILFLLSVSYVYSQSFNIQSTVYDSITKKPVSEAYIYFEGTSVYTISDEQGKFELTVDRIYNSPLVISHVAYDVIKIINPYLNFPKNFYLNEKDEVLDEAVVYSEIFSRGEKLEAFRKNFLGENGAGRSCQILNEDDIEIFYNPETRILSSSSDKFIIVDNSFLGYKIVLKLIDFKAEYKKTNVNHSIKQSDMIISAFTVSAFFIDEGRNKRKYKRRRNIIYDTSFKKFMKLFAVKNLRDYTIYDNMLNVNPYELITITDTLSMKKVIINPKLELDPEYGKKVYDKFGVTYNKNNTWSIISFLTKEFYINEQGELVDENNRLNINNPVIIHGYWSEQLIGTSLPVNFEPE